MNNCVLFHFILPIFRIIRETAAWEILSLDFLLQVPMFCWERFKEKINFFEIQTSRRKMQEDIKS